MARSRLPADGAADAVVLEEWLSLPPASLDVVVSLHTLEHLPQPRRMMQQLARQAGPGRPAALRRPQPGRASGTASSAAWFAYRDPTHCSLLSRGEWVMLARRAGLEVFWVRGDGMWDPPYVVCLPLGSQRLLFGAPAGSQLFSPLAPAVSARRAWGSA